MSLIKQILIIIFVSIFTLKIADIAFGFAQSKVISSGLSKGTDRSIVLRELNPNQSASIQPNNNYMKDVENLEQINYEISIDENGFIKQIIDILGLPAKMIKSDAQVQQIREERAMEQQQQMEMQQQMAESQMAKNAAPLAKVVQDGSE